MKELLRRYYGYINEIARMYEGDIDDILKRYEELLKTDWGYIKYLLNISLVILRRYERYFREKLETY